MNMRLLFFVLQEFHQLLEYTNVIAKAAFIRFLHIILTQISIKII